MTVSSTEKGIRVRARKEESKVWSSEFEAEKRNLSRILTGGAELAIVASESVDRRPEMMTLNQALGATLKSE